MNRNRVAQFLCSLFGHDVTQVRTQSSGGIQWETIETCGNCRLSNITVDHKALHEINRRKFNERQEI